MFDQYLKNKIEKERKSMFGFFLRNWRIVYILTIGIFLLGMFSGLNLPREANPEVKVPIAIVSTVWQGADPESIESQVTDVLEDKILNLSDLKRVSSTSYPNISLIVVEFLAEADIDSSIRKLRDKVSQAEALLPDTADNPEVIEIDLNNIPVITFSLVSNTDDENKLKVVSDEIASRLESINGVSRIEVIGSRDDEIRVNLDAHKMSIYSIPLNSVIASLKQLDIDVPVGSFKIDGYKYNAKLVSDIDGLSDIENLEIRSSDGKRYYLYEIGSVEKAKEDIETISKAGFKDKKARLAVSVQVYKESEGNILYIADEAKKIIEDMKKTEEIPQDIDVIVANDNSVFVREDFDTLTKSGIQTLILIAIVVALVLNLRMTLIAVLSIPLVYLSAFIWLDIFDETLNSLTLFSLILSLGLLIDTAIVVMEGITDGLKRGLSSYDAALAAIALYKSPVTSGVLTTIAAFVPMFLVKGVVGEFMKVLPTTISIVLLSSLVIGLVFIPVYAYRTFRKTSNLRKKGLFQTVFMVKFAKGYYRFLQNVLNKTGFRRTVMVSVMILFSISIFLVFGGVIKTSLFPDFDADYFLVNLEMPPGTELEKTIEKTEEVERYIQEIPELKNYIVNIGTNVGLAQTDSRNVGRKSENFAVFTVNLKEKSLRDRKSYIIADELRSKLSQIGVARVEVVELEGGPPTGAPIDVRVEGKDLDILENIALTIKEKISDIEGVEDINISARRVPPQISFRINKVKTSFYGVSPADIVQYMQSALLGLKVVNIKKSVLGSDTDLVVYFENNFKQNIDDLLNIKVPTSKGYISLSELVEISLVEDASAIFHIDGERVVSVTARNEGRSVPEIKKDIDKAIEDIKVPSGYKIYQSGEFEEQNKAFFDLYKSMVVAVILIFLIMVLQFNSFKQPFIILISIPLGFIGVVIGLLILGIDLNFPAFLGIVSLSGIVVNDAIILIDRINENIRERGLRIKEAIFDAGRSRLEPVIMTTITTVLGVIPLAFANEFWLGLSIAIAFGLSFASFLTLVFIPMLYMMWNKES